MVPPTKVKKRHIKQKYLDKNAGFIKPDRLLSVTPNIIRNFTAAHLKLPLSIPGTGSATTPSAP
jgi:hypothetical protein